MKNKMLLLIALAMSVSAVHASTSTARVEDDASYKAWEAIPEADRAKITGDEDYSSYVSTQTPSALRKVGSDYIFPDMAATEDDFSTPAMAYGDYKKPAAGEYDSPVKGRATSNFNTVGWNKEGSAIEEVADRLEAEEPNKPLSPSFRNRLSDRYSDRYAIGGDLTQLLGLGAGLGMAANGRRLADAAFIKRYIKSEKARLAAIYSAAAALGLLGHVAGSKLSGDENLFIKGYKGGKRGVEKFKANRAAKKAAKAA